MRSICFVCVHSEPTTQVQSRSPIKIVTFYRAVVYAITVHNSNDIISIMWQSLSKDYFSNSFFYVIRIAKSIYLVSSFNLINLSYCQNFRNHQRRQFSFQYMRKYCLIYKYTQIIHAKCVIVTLPVKWIKHRLSFIFSSKKAWTEQYKHVKWYSHHTVVDNWRLWTYWFV